MKYLHTKNYLSCNTFERSDGGPMKLKLIIGSKTVNLLVTCSVEISTAVKVSIGPGVEFNYGLILDEKCKIYLIESRIAGFLKKFEDYQYNQSPISISNLTSSFNKCSSYLLWRPTLPEFDSTIYSPITIFNLCDLPNNDGYNAGATSAVKLTSNILQLFATAVSIKKGII